MVDAVVRLAPPTTLAAVHEVLKQAQSTIAAIGAADSVDDEAAVSPVQLVASAPADIEPDAPVTPEELADADAAWAAARARGRRHRDAVRAVAGPLLTPRQVADRLGLSPASVNNWRRQGRLLALQLDRHQHLYPALQFADDPGQGEHGVVRGLDRALTALAGQTPWAQVVFLTGPAPALGGRRPIDVLRTGEPGAVERVSQVAGHAFEHGVA
jgi:uncharacterized protein (DUF2384 family)